MPARKYLVISVFLAFLAISTPVSAESFQYNEAEFMSKSGYYTYLALGVTLPTLSGEENGLNHSIRTIDSILVANIITEMLKQIVREERPNGSDNLSFPSGHASTAFAIARMESEYHPDQAWAWYLGAALIAESRVALREHFVHDVVAGALIGYCASEWELHNRRGLLLFPIIDPDTRTVGLAAAISF